MEDYWTPISISISILIILQVKFEENALDKPFKVRKSGLIW